MPYMAPSATHQPELLLLNWMLCTIATLIGDPHCARPNSPDVLFHQHTSLPTLFATPQHPPSLDQYRPRSPTRAQQTTIHTWLPRLPWTLSHGPHGLHHTRPNTLPLRHYTINHHNHLTTHRHNTSPPSTPSPGSIPLPRTPPSYHTFTSEPHNTSTASHHQHYPNC